MNNINEKLDIIIVTYNRKEFLKKTFEQIFADNSPIKSFDITVLNNASTDGTFELVEEYRLKYPNLKHIINNRNINGNPNISKALVEIPQKDYVWVLSDNDDYDWSVWNEVEIAVQNRTDAIFTRNCPDSIASIFYTATLVSGCIYRTGIITSAVIENIYNYIKFLFPHLAMIAQVINKNGSYSIVSKDIVHSGINPEHDKSFVRGLDREDLSEDRKNIFWSVGYFSTVSLITDKKKRSEIIDGARHYHKSLFDLFKTAMVKNKVLYKNYPNNFMQIFRVLNFRQKFKFILAFLIINFSFKNYKFYEIRSAEQWADYFTTIKEQRYIDKLAKKLQEKKIVLYGAGIISEILIKNFDLSKLNIIAISDKRFERTGEKEFFGIKTIKPSELKNTDFNAVVFTLKLYKKIEKSLKTSGINKKMYSIIKKDNKYPVRF
jgi:glycosyltransferase involved in cell wall biosynthesis